MPNYRRAHDPGGSFFFTVVTNQRAPLFSNTLAVQTLGDCLRRCQARWPFEVNAIVVLPDHLHAIWSLPPGDTDYSRRWAWIKKEFTKRWLERGETAPDISAARQNERRGGVWQPRFWEHTLRDEDDFERHFDYVHYNPVKHGLVRRPHDWEHSSFHRWVRRGVYDKAWACGDPDCISQRMAGMGTTTGE